MTPAKMDQIVGRGDHSVSLGCVLSEKHGTDRVSNDIEEASSHNVPNLVILCRCYLAYLVKVKI